MLFSRKPEPGKKTLIFIHGQPAVLPDINAESFLSNNAENALIEMTVGVVKEIDPFWRTNFCFWGSWRHHVSVLQRSYTQTAEAGATKITVPFVAGEM